MSVIYIFFFIFLFKSILTHLNTCKSYEQFHYYQWVWNLFSCLSALQFYISFSLYSYFIAFAYSLFQLHSCLYNIDDIPCGIVEKAMATHSSTLAWEIPWMEEPGGLQSTGSRRVGHDWATSLSLFTFLHWRRKWQPTPVFLPGESQGQGSLVGCRLWGHTESDTTDVT